MTLADVRTEHPLAMTTAEEVERVRAALAEAGLLGDTVRFAFFLARGAAEGRGARVQRRRRRRPALPRRPARPRQRALLGHGRLRDERRGRLAARARPGHRRASRRSSTRRVHGRRGDREGRRRAGWPRSNARGIDPTVVRAVPAVGGRRTTTPDEAGRRMLRVLRLRARTTRRTTAGRTRSTASSPTSTSPRAGSTGSSTHGAAAGAARATGNFDDPELQRAAAHDAQADRDHPARGPSFTVDGERGAGGASGTCGSASTRARAWCCTRSRSTAAADRLPGVVAEMVVPVRRPVARCGSGRTTSTPASTCSARSANSLQLGCDCLGEIHYFDAVHRRRPGRPADHPERDLHARGGLRRRSGSTPTCSPGRARPAASAAW